MDDVCDLVGWLPWSWLFRFECSAKCASVPVYLWCGADVTQSAALLDGVDALVRVDRIPDLFYEYKGWRCAPWGTDWGIDESCATSQ